MTGILDLLLLLHDFLNEKGLVQEFETWMDKKLSDKYIQDINSGNIYTIENDEIKRVGAG